jgi:hypothetical protein
MAISYTYHGARVARQEDGRTPDALLKSIGARVDVADAAASAALGATGWYRIAASTTSYVLISDAATNGTGGFHMPAGSVEVLHIEAGDKIGCSAGA